VEPEPDDGLKLGRRHDRCPPIGQLRRLLGPKDGAGATFSTSDGEISTATRG
jgi:hypothetical protein